MTWDSLYCSLTATLYPYCCYITSLNTRQVEHAARLLLERGYTVDVAYTSMLKRYASSATYIYLTISVEDC